MQKSRLQNQRAFMNLLQCIDSQKVSSAIYRLQMMMQGIGGRHIAALFDSQRDVMQCVNLTSKTWSCNNSSTSFTAIVRSESFLIYNSEQWQYISKSASSIKRLVMLLIQPTLVPKQLVMVFIQSILVRIRSIDFYRVYTRRLVAQAAC